MPRSSRLMRGSDWHICLPQSPSTCMHVNITNSYPVCTSMPRRTSPLHRTPYYFCATTYANCALFTSSFHILWPETVQCGCVCPFRSETSSCRYPSGPSFIREPTPSRFISSTPTRLLCSVLPSPTPNYRYLTLSTSILATSTSTLTMASAPVTSSIGNSLFAMLNITPTLRVGQLPR